MTNKKTPSRVREEVRVKTKFDARAATCRCSTTTAADARSSWGEGSIGCALRVARAGAETRNSKLATRNYVMRPERTEAIVLNTYAARERDKLVVFLTPDHGKRKGWAY